MKKNKFKIVITLLFILVVTIGLAISYRSAYLQTLEIGENYLDVFNTNIKYKYQAMAFNFILFFIILLVENLIIKNGLSPFFRDENKEMPKLANKSISFILSVIVSLVVSSLFTDKIILFMNSIWIGTSDPIFNMDIGFYLFQKPFIEFCIYYIIGVLFFVSVFVFFFIRLVRLVIMFYSWFRLI